MLNDACYSNQKDVVEVEPMRDPMENVSLLQKQLNELQLENQI